MKDLKIAVAGTGYVGLSIATLLSQHHQVTAVDIVPEKVKEETLRGLLKHITEESNPIIVLYKPSKIIL